MARCRLNLIRIAAVVVLAGLSSFACQDVPIHDVSKTFSIEVSEKTEHQDPIKVDFLWIIDNSASMCQEQFALSQSFDDFASDLKKYLKNIDIRLAVTTTDAISRAGEFANDPASNFPPACFEHKVYPCLGHEDCVKRYGNGWECSGYSASQMYNKNKSINSQCIFRCDGDSVCCEEFCTDDFEECKSDEQSCIKDMCKDSPNESCLFECKQPGQGTSGSGCLRPPNTESCPSKLPKVLTMDTLHRFKCNAIVEPEQSYQANIEQGLKAAWLALDPDGPNAVQVEGFLRDDAYLVIVFISDEDDCSIDGEFCSPNYTCDDDDDCPAGSKCKTDWYFSQKKQKKIKLCCGTVKKDYYNVCSLLGDYKGKAHHSCAYDLSCDDCSTSDDCDYGWHCKQGQKCRPDIYSLTNIASYQSPPGTPIFSLTPVAEYYSLFRSLKSDPAKVLVAVITGDGEPLSPSKKKGEEPSLISDACLDDDKLLMCQEFKKAKASAGTPEECIADPSADGCEDYFAVKLECIRECYVASKGDSQSPTVAKNTYICESQFGKADFGARYVQLVDMFGPNGVMSNICSEDGIAPALESIAELVIKRVTKICLPMEVKVGETILVTEEYINEDGTLTTNQLLVGEDYKIEEPTQDCCFPDESGNCTGTLKALIFNDILDPDAIIEVRYVAELNLGGTTE